MGTLNLSQVVERAIPLEELTLPMVAELSSDLNRAPFQRSNRVNIRLREDDICELQARALSAGMSLQAFLAEIVHQYARNNLVDKLADNLADK